MAKHAGNTDKYILNRARINLELSFALFEVAVVHQHTALFLIHLFVPFPFMFSATYAALGYSAGNKKSLLLPVKLNSALTASRLSLYCRAVGGWYTICSPIFFRFALSDLENVVTRRTHRLSLYKEERRNKKGLQLINFWSLKLFLWSKRVTIYDMEGQQGAFAVRINVGIQYDYI